jgi:RNA:NAD 2'-phosphotransferase (TPT1/KptA family)
MRRSTYVPKGRFGLIRMFICALFGHRWVRFDSTIEVCKRCSDGRYSLYV